MDELNSNPDGENVNYWEWIKDFDPTEQRRRIQDMITSENGQTKLQEWAGERQDFLMHCYIWGLKGAVKEATLISFNNWVVFLYVAKVWKGGINLEPLDHGKPLLKREADQLNEKFKETNVQREIDNLLDELGLDPNDPE